MPGGLPLLNFPEISMWGQSPWGGYGANPLPARLQRLWNQTQRKLSGGTPYSEGIYEDINKAICSQFYWDPERPAVETVREYAAFEYSPDVADDVVKVVEAFEKNHLRKADRPERRRGVRARQAHRGEADAPGPRSLAMADCLSARADRPRTAEDAREARRQDA